MLLKKLSIYILTQLFFLIACFVTIFYVLYFYRKVNSLDSLPFNPILNDLNIIYAGIALGIVVNILFSFIPNLSNEIFFILCSGGSVFYLLNKTPNDFFNTKNILINEDVYKIISSFNLNTVLVGFIIGYFFIDIFEKIFNKLTKGLSFLKNIFLRASFASLFCFLHSLLGLYFWFILTEKKIYSFSSYYTLLTFLYNGISLIILLGSFLFGLLNT